MYFKGANGKDVPNFVGLVLGTDMSRLARSSRDWYQLLEICAVFFTLLADADIQERYCSV
jgi:hypothetical protein